MVYLTLYLIYLTLYLVRLLHLILYLVYLALYLVYLTLYLVPRTLYLVHLIRNTEAETTDSQGATPTCRHKETDQSISPLPALSVTI